MAATQSAIYAVVNRQLWRYENESTGWENIGSKKDSFFGYVEAVSASADGQTIYAMDWNGLNRRKENEDWTLIAPQDELYKSYIPHELITSMASNRLAVSNDGQTLYIDSRYPQVKPHLQEKIKKGLITRDGLIPAEHIWALRENEIKALWNDRIDLEDYFWGKNDPLGNIPFRTYYPDNIELGPDGVYVARQYTLDDNDKDSYLKVFKWNWETGWQDYSKGLDGNFTPSGFGVSAASNGMWVSNMIDWAYWRNKEGVWTRLPQSLVSKWINNILIDPNSPNVAYLGTNNGIYWTFGNNNWKLSLIGGESEGSANISEQLKVNLITYHPGWKVPLIATDKGVYFAVVSQQQNWLLAFWGTAKRVYQDNYTSPLFWFINLISVYLLGIVALLISAWKGGSTIFARTALISFAAKPLLIAPGLGRWILFIGYRHRLTGIHTINENAKSYFGLPAKDSKNSIILPDSTGSILHERISDELRPQKPTLIIGKGGAGKSTLLTQWAFLALRGKISDSLKGFRPVIVPASYYGGSLIKAITDTLRERDGVAVDEKIVHAQLQSGKFLILFDGVSEVVNNPNQSLKEILRTASNADYKKCRFLIATRPLAGIAPDMYTIYLQPLTSDVISVLLPRYHLGPERENRIRRQLQSFGDKPIEPLLFSMAMAQSTTEQMSASRSQLYERYFRRLLRLESESDDISWEGWRTALETIAHWFLLDTGRRGVGLPYRHLVKLITGRSGDKQAGENLVEALRRDFHLSASDEVGLLQKLKAAGLLQSGRRWCFAHDTYEEYFAASALVSHLELKGNWPYLKKWLSSFEQEQGFCEVIEFINEMIEDEARQQLMKLKLPATWRDLLQRKGGNLAAEGE